MPLIQSDLFNSDAQLMCLYISLDRFMQISSDFGAYADDAKKPKNTGVHFNSV